MVKLKTNLIGGVFTVLLGIGLLLLMPSQIDSTLMVTDEYIDASFAPQVVSMLMVFLGLTLVIQSIIFKKENIVEIKISQIKRIAFFTLILIGGVILFYLFGFLISTAATSGIILWYLRNRNWKMYMICAIIILIVYLAFTMLLQVQLP